MENQLLTQLAKHLSLTDVKPEDEPYILTKNEEDRLLSNAIASAQSHMAWKMRRLYATEDEIFHRLQLINWDEHVNREELLQRGNMIKHHEIWQKEQRKKEKDEIIRKHKELEEMWTAKRMYQLMSWTSQNVYGKKLVVNDHTKKLITAICYFVSRDPRFESELGYDLKKGILIRGATGLGKTYAVQCIQDNGLNPIILLSMLAITDAIQQEGEFKIEMGEKKIVYMDDVGTEQPVVKFYGTNIMFFKNFIETTYLRQKSFNSLIISTNENFKGLEGLYGFRVVSRMREMFNVLDVFGEDMRIKKGNVANGRK